MRAAAPRCVFACLVTGAIFIVQCSVPPSAGAVASEKPGGVISGLFRVRYVTLSASAYIDQTYAKEK